MTDSPLLPAAVASATFLLLTGAMTGATVLLLQGVGWVSPRWRLPVSLAGLTALIGVLHYAMSLLVWLRVHDVSVVYRYADWMLAMPVQVLAMYFVVST